jgi:hypothetical protein
MLAFCNLLLFLQTPKHPHPIHDSDNRREPHDTKNTPPNIEIIASVSENYGEYSNREEYLSEEPHPETKHRSLHGLESSYRDKEKYISPEKSQYNRRIFSTETDDFSRSLNIIARDKERIEVVRDEPDDDCHRDKHDWTIPEWEFVGFLNSWEIFRTIILSNNRRGSDRETDNWEEHYLLYTSPNAIDRHDIGTEFFEKSIDDKYTDSDENHRKWRRNSDMKNLANCLPSWSPSSPITERENAATMKHRNHIHETHELDRHGRPGDSRDAHSLEPSGNTEHEERIETDIDDSSDDKCPAIGPCITIRIEDTIDGVGKEKQECKWENWNDIAQRHCLDCLIRHTSEEEQLWSEIQERRCEHENEKYTQEDNMLHKCPNSFVIFWSQSIADESRGCTRETVAKYYEEEKNRECLTHSSRRFDTELPCPVCICDIEKRIEKESDSCRESDFPEERRDFIGEEIWLSRHRIGV